MTTDLILGIDGGGTKTVAWIAAADDAQTVLGKGTSGPANAQAVGIETALQNLDRAINAAFADANLSRRLLAATCFGLAGADRACDQLKIQEWATRTQLTQRLHIVNDAFPVLFSANPDGYGIAIISGTGSFAFGRNSDGATARAGGWGYLIGDEGSAYAIALDALRAVAKSADGRGPNTSLREPILRALGRNKPEELIPAIYDPAMTRSRIASLCRLVLEAVQEHDAVATEIINTAACDLAEMVIAVTSRLNVALNSFPLAMTGGVLLHNLEIRSRLESAIRDRGFTPDPMTMVTDPVRGCLSIAERSLSGQFPGDAIPTTVDP